MGKLSVLILVIICLFTEKGYAQNLIPNHIKTNNGEVYAIEEDENNVYVGGIIGPVGYDKGSFVKVDTTGSVDLDFLKIDGSVHTVVSDNLGGWYLGGFFQLDSFKNLVHLLPNYKIDKSFKASVNDTVRTLLLDGSDLYVGGDFTQYNGAASKYLVKVNASSGVEINWITYPNNSINTLSLDGDLIYVGGFFTAIANKYNKGFAMINKETGEVLESVSDLGKINVIQHDDENIYIGGRGSNTIGFYTGSNARFENGKFIPDNKFPVFEGRVNVVVSDNNGGWYIAGLFTYGGKSNFIHILPDNTLDEKFSPNEKGEIYCVILDGDTLFTAGFIEHLDGVKRQLTAINKTTGASLLWNTDWSNNSAINLSADDKYLYVVSPNFEFLKKNMVRVLDKRTGVLVRSFTFTGYLRTIDNDSENIYFGGDFTGEQGYKTGALGYFKGESNFPDLDYYVADGVVHDIISDNKGGWYVGGFFGSGEQASLIHILADGRVNPDFKPSLDRLILTMLLEGDTLYVGGNLNRLFGQYRRHLAAINVKTNELLPLSLQFDKSVSAIAKDGDKLYVGGEFSVVDEFNNRSFTIVDLKTGKAIPSTSTSGSVNDIVFDSEYIYVGGSFSSNGIYTGSVAEFRNGNDLPNLNFPKILGEIKTIIPDNRGGWLVGGLFTVGNKKNLIRIKPDLTVDESFTVDVGASVKVLHLYNNTLYLAGDFYSVDGYATPGLASINAISGIWESWNPRSAAGIKTILRVGNVVYIGGDYITAAGVQRSGYAALDAKTGQEISFSIGNTFSPDINSIELIGDKIVFGGDFKLYPYGTTDSVFNIVVLDTNRNQLQHYFSTNDIVNSIKKVGDKIFVVGRFTSINNQPRSRIAEIDLNQGLVTSRDIKADSEVTTIGHVNNKVYFAGKFKNINSSAQSRLVGFDLINNSVLDWDPAMSTDVNVVAATDTSVLVGGLFQYAKSVPGSNFFAISKSDGLPKNLNLGTAGGSVEDLCIANNRLYIAGSFSQISGQPRNGIAEMDLNTKSLTSWDINVNGTVRKIAINNDELLIGGVFTSVSGQNRLNAASIDRNTKQVTSWDPRPSKDVYAVSINETSKILGGTFDFFNSKTRNYAMAISKTSGLITGWDPNVNDTINVIRVDGDHVFIGGKFTMVGSASINCLARTNKLTGQSDSWNAQIVKVYGTETFVSLIEKNGEKLYLGGTFRTVGAKDRRNFAVLNILDGTLTYERDPYFEIRPSDIAFYQNQYLAGGTFKYINRASGIGFYAINKTTKLVADWQPMHLGEVNTIVRIDDMFYLGGSLNSVSNNRNALSLLPLYGEKAASYSLPIDNVIRDMKMVGDKLYIAGDFKNVGGVSRNHVASIRISDSSLTNWNPNPNNKINKIIPAGDAFLIAGHQNLINQVVRNGLFSYSKSNNRINSWNPNVTGIVYALEASKGKLYIGGDFSQILSTSRNRFAEVDLSTGLLTELQIPATNTISAFSSWKNKLFIGGKFNGLNGMSITKLAGYDLDTKQIYWVPVPDGNVNCLYVHDDKLYVGGSFVNISHEEQPGSAIFDLNDMSLSEFNPKVTGEVFSYHVSEDNTLYIGGNYTKVDQQDRGSISSFNLSTKQINDWKPTVYGVIYGVGRVGENVLLGGNFTQTNGIANRTLAVLDNISGQMKYVYHMDGQIRRFLVNNNRVLLGGAFRTDISSPYINLATYSNTLIGERPELKSITPESGGETGIITAYINGKGFSEGTSVKLTKNGEPDFEIPSGSTFLKNGQNIHVILDLTQNITIGEWDVVVTVPNDTVMILENAFTVEQRVNPMIDINLIGFSNIRPEVWQTYNVTVTNSGNIDAKGLPIFIAIDPHIELKMLNQLTTTNQQGNIILKGEPKSIITVDTINGKPYVAKVYALMLANLTGGTTDVISFKVKTSGTSPFNIRVWNNYPLYDPYLKGQYSYCMQNIVNQGVSKGAFNNDVLNVFESSAGCGISYFETKMNQIFTALRYTPSYSVLQSNNVTSTGGILTDYSWLLTEVFENCGISQPSVVAKNLLDIEIGKSLVASVSFKAYNPCSSIKNYIIGDPVTINVVTSVDPNDKQGPSGKGEYNYIHGGNVNIPYIIRYENVDTATAAAQVVIVVDTLDLSVFDPSTFTLGGMQIADKLIPVPFGLQTYTTDIDLRPDNNLILRANADFDQSTGIAKWIFTSLDVNTLLPTEDPTAGYLPPNVNSPEGQGSVMFTVRTKESITHETRITNDANIYFDLNEPILTNDWLNKIDNVKPISKMKSLPSVQYNDTIISLSWSGSDIGVGVSSYSVYYSVNDGDFELLIENIEDSNLLFTGDFDSTYSFFVVATDFVGNVEDMKFIAEATIRLERLITGINDQIRQLDAQIYPNPNQGNFNLSVTAIFSGKFDINITDVAGRTVYRKIHQLNSGGNIVPLEIIQPGIYFLSIVDEKSKVVKTVVVSK